MREFITLIENAPTQWAPVLNDSYEIADYLESVSTNHLDHGEMVENWKGCRAILKMVPIDQIKASYADLHAQYPERDAEYARMDPATMPPLLLDNGIIEDGHHRYRAALKMGLTELLCYVIIESPSYQDDEGEEEDDTDDWGFQRS